MLSHDVSYLYENLFTFIRFIFEISKQNYDVISIDTVRIQ